MDREQEINARIAEIEATVEPLRREAKSLVAERDQITTAKAARAKLGAMGSAERRALAQIIAAEGVESGEEVGIPGN